jgi:hypothetical protein
MSLLLLSGCDVANNARSDFSRVTSAIASTAQAPPAGTPSSARRTNTAAPTKVATVQDPPKPEPPPQDPPPVSLVGKSEAEIRTLFGPPTSEEDRAPGKTWHYQDGQCAMDVQLYPDVQTRQFGTLAYEVRSNDSTDEGKRLCVAQLHSRTQASGG